MNIVNTLRGLLRRWYVVVPGILLAVVVALCAWFVVKPGYERTASEQLLPGLGTLPEGATNPYLYLGGLSPAADLLVRAAGSEEALRPILKDNPGVEVEYARDAAASGPVIVITVTAPSDAAAGAVLDELVDKTARTLETIQEEEDVPSASRITIRPISVDQESELQQRDRLVMSAGAGVVILVLTIVLASVVDGLAARTRRPRRTEADPVQELLLDGPLPEVAEASETSDAGPVEAMYAEAHTGARRNRRSRSEPADGAAD